MTDHDLDVAEPTLQQGLTEEVRALIADRLSSGSAVPATWLLHETMQRHNRVEGEDADLALLALRFLIQRTVREVLRDKKKDESELKPQSELFAGYTRVQRSYLVERDGEQTVVRVEDLSDDEWQTKVGDLRAMSVGCMTHAKELEDFFRARGRIVA